MFYNLFNASYVVSLKNMNELLNIFTLYNHTNKINFKIVTTRRIYQ